MNAFHSGEIRPFIPSGEICPRVPNSPITREIAAAFADRLKAIAERRAELSDRIANEAVRSDHLTLYGIAAAVGVARYRTDAARDAAVRLAAALTALECAALVTTPETFKLLSAAIEAGRVATAESELVARAEALAHLDEEVYSSPGDRVIGDGLYLALANGFAHSIRAEITNLSVITALPAEWRHSLLPNVPEMSAIMDNLAIAERWLQHADRLAAALVKEVEAVSWGLA